MERKGLQGGEKEVVSKPYPLPLLSPPLALHLPVPINLVRRLAHAHLLPVDLKTRE
jgi:hypothetical protein